MGNPEKINLSLHAKKREINQKFPELNISKTTVFKIVTTNNNLNNVP